MIKAPPAPVERISVSPLPEPGVVIKFTQPNRNVFYHSGDAGDIIYALLFVKSLGGGRMFIGPDNRWGISSNNDVQRYQWILPLIAAQPYISSVEYVEKKPEAGITHDLNTFREIWGFSYKEREKMGITRLFEAYPARFGKGRLSESQTWIEVDPIVDAQKPVVIHRSARYRNPDFPWDEVRRRYEGKIIFVGLKQEYEEWKNRYGHGTVYRPTDNALDICRLIAGASLFIGNQSSPCAMAIGLGKDLIQETFPPTPDCVFRRSNAQYFFRNPINWPAI